MKFQGLPESETHPSFLRGYSEFLGTMSPEKVGRFV